MSIKFGTDGWRAVISDEFTFANVQHVAQAIADVVWEDAADAMPIFVVGYDTRFLSDRFAAAVACVLAANDIQVLLTDRFAATPAVSYAIVQHQAQGGVMLTASHNPPRYNGLKLKANYGGSASAGVIARVEQKLGHNLATGSSPRTMDWQRVDHCRQVVKFDPYPAYAQHIRRMVDFDLIANSNLRVAVDAMYGAGIGYTDRLLREGGVTPVLLHHEMNPGFGGLHPEPIERYLGELRDTVRKEDLMLGLATDGDADRIGAMTRQGEFITPHVIMTLLLDHLLGRGERGAVVKTVSTTQMLNVLAQQHDLVVHETPVGFNYISDLMLSQDVLIGGEESGGISIKHHIPEGDGVLMSLLLTELLAANGGDFDALWQRLAAQVGIFAYGRHDYEVTPFSKQELVRRLVDCAPNTIAGLKLEDLNLRDGVKYLMTGGSWLLIRPSGTEPVLRVYAEASDKETVGVLLQAGRELSLQAMAVAT